MVDGRESVYNAGDLGSIPGLVRPPGERNGNPLLYSWLEPRGQTSLVGYSPWDRKESDMTERLTEHNHNQWEEKRNGESKSQNVKYQLLVGGDRQQQIDVSKMDRGEIGTARERKMSGRGRQCCLMVKGQLLTSWTTLDQFIPLSLSYFIS